eukprot:scaffold109593_cov33-Tisochrysis_lutea.AAC.2
MEPERPPRGLPSKTCSRPRGPVLPLPPPRPAPSSPDSLPYRPDDLSSLYEYTSGICEFLTSYLSRLLARLLARGRRSLSLLGGVSSALLTGASARQSKVNTEGSGPRLGGQLLDYH